MAKNEISASFPGCFFKRIPQKGRVFWITGLAGAGKTTIAKSLYQALKREKTNLILLDGDMLRMVFNKTHSYSLKSRFGLAMQYAKLCQLISDQGIDVICATISMFDKCRDWNRKNLTNYFEVYVKVPLTILKKRNQKGLYTQALQGKDKSVVGISQIYEEPKSPDLILENDGRKNIAELCDEIINSIKKGLKG